MSTVTAVPLQPVKRGYIVWLWIGIALAVLVAAALAWAGDTGQKVTPSGVRYMALAPVKDGPHPTDTDITLINYTGKLTDGTVFDQSRQPTPMPVAGVVPGFAEALKLMPKGAKYRVWIPPQLGYGANGAGKIPPNSTLVFDIELVDFLPMETLRQMQAQQAAMQGGRVPGGSIPEAPTPAAPSPEPVPAR